MSGRKRLANSWAEDFYRDFFSRIDEDTFAGLYVDHPSRPNVPVNWLVGLETLDEDAVEATLGSVLKYREDHDVARAKGLAWVADG